MFSEDNGSRRLPILIGSAEAQSIAIELEKMTASRPLTHDLFKKFSQTFNIDVKEVIIYNLVQGVFYSKLICKQGDIYAEFDSRTSDAIAIAVRFNCPIYTYDFILSSAGISFEQEVAKEMEELEQNDKIDDVSIDDLEQQLEEALRNEEYEKASKIRDEINKRKH